MARKTTTKARNFAFILYPESLPDDWEMKLEKIGNAMAISPLHDKDAREKKSKDAIRKEAERTAETFILELKKRDFAGELLDEDREVIEVREAALKEGQSPEQAEEAIKKYVAKHFVEKLTQEQEQGGFKKPHYHVLYINGNPVTAESVVKKVRRAFDTTKAIAHCEIVDNVENYYKYLTHESKDAIAKNKQKYDSKDIKLLNGFDLDRYVTMDKAQKEDLFLEIVNFVRKEQITNFVDLLDRIDEIGETIGIKNQREFKAALDGNGWYLKMVLDGNYQNVEKAKKSLVEHMKNKQKKEERARRMQESTRKDYVNTETGDIVDTETGEILERGITDVTGQKTCND